MTKSISEKKKLDKLTQGTIKIDLAIACHLRDLLLGANNGKVWKVTEVSGHISEPEINCGMRERRKIILDRGSTNTQCTSICKVCETRIVSQDEITEVERVLWDLASIKAWSQCESTTAMLCFAHNVKTSIKYNHTAAERIQFNTCDFVWEKITASRYAHKQHKIWLNNCLKNMIFMVFIKNDWKVFYQHYGGYEKYYKWKYICFSFVVGFISMHLVSCPADDLCIVLWKI